MKDVVLRNVPLKVPEKGFAKSRLFLDRLAQLDNEIIISIKCSSVRFGIPTSLLRDSSSILHEQNRMTNK